MTKFVQGWDSRFRTLMWSDSRLVDKQAVFCLCTTCLKEDVVKGVECSTHKAFMRMTRILNIAAPVFSCLLFVKDTSRPNKTDVLYEPSCECVEDLKQEIETLKDRYKTERADTFSRNLEEQQRIWGVDKNFQPLQK